ncbi:WD repeat protein [Aulographum hederae CBS 113979]|uniref:Ribosome assembly protein 4 n=1 Tax=Aulographum hederae CBS 113979 TaxID=1176131 RepID=A0A6G1GN07_9PEZI|nr:WD repeat protein [Aulographum hederae CBS 113979]
MATVVPPPSKRQKTAAAAITREQQQPQAKPQGDVRLHFVDPATGRSIGPPIVVPLARANTRNLNILVNSLQGQEDANDRVRYRFVLQADPDAPTGSDQALPTDSDLADIIGKQAAAGAEATVTLQPIPEAVFRVKAVSRCSAAISGHGQAILAIQFSPVDSSRMVSGSGDNHARIWDCETGTPLATLKGHTGWVGACSYSPEGDIIATGSQDKTVRLWESKKGKPVGHPMTGHTRNVMALSWEPYHLQAPGRPRLASASKDMTVRIWDTTSQRADIVLSGHKACVSCVKWGGTGFIYTASHDRTVRVWNASDGTLAHNLAQHAHWVNHLALSTDLVLRTAYHDHTGKVPPTPEAKLAKAKQRFTDAATIAGEVVEKLVTASDDCTIFLWDPSSTKPTKPLARLAGHQKQVNHVSFSPDGLYIASAGFDNHVKLWAARDGKFISTLRGHVAAVYQCCFSADSRLLVSASKDTTCKVWDVRSGKLKEDLPGHKDEVYALDWSADGERVGSGGKDKQVRIWRH